ncbi:protein naked cuticle homolog 2-like [Sinocyclocheilus rhinocerous]|uniref:protein naked cuticle homolog 2-like n=1 Tax=Sinocyclocheilus rhinocerous TaxID=307959 RepID=UPI0007B9F2AC|nr:PREDICTED: protein naked cuticle homolog 2-like [Sinocyclocheilus rhinocerous]
MGKLHSKHACKRRENPEGDSFVANGIISRRGVEGGERYDTNLKDYKELKDGQMQVHHCPLQVVLPPEKAEGCESFRPSEDRERDALKETCKGKKRISLDDLECNVSLVDDNRQEWVFTLYDFDNSGRVTKEDMSSLMHTVYDVVDASVNHSCNGKRKTLRVKLTVTPEPRARRRDTTHTGNGGDK